MISYVIVIFLFIFFLFLDDEDYNPPDDSSDDTDCDEMNDDMKDNNNDNNDNDNDLNNINDNDKNKFSYTNAKKMWKGYDPVTKIDSIVNDTVISNDDIIFHENLENLNFNIQSINKAIEKSFYSFDSISGDFYLR
jgi:hypothetical protein